METELDVSFVQCVVHINIKKGNKNVISGKAVVGSINCRTSKIYKYDDYHL